ncbi:TIGR02234 family membrane protein [Streptacidiphilus sp. EB129]|uniref:TIGR02234 family membrane protein n=1 Tax=Streptacidiphilus sp. EB129 TaxID=3156262 RepID=UPI0035115FDA
MTALPQPRTEADSGADAQPGATDVPGDAAAARGGSGSRRSLALMLLLTVLGAALVLLAVGQTWARGTVDFQGTRVAVSAGGSQTTGLPGALALVGLAAAVAVFAVRGAARRAVGLLLALAGAAAAVAAVTGAAGDDALNRRAVAAVGLSRAVATGVSHSVWPWAAAVGGLLLLAAGLLVLVRGRDWPGMSSRYEAPAKPAVTKTTRNNPDSPADLWKALDRGEDPTT